MKSKPVSLSQTAVAEPKPTEMIMIGTTQFQMDVALKAALLIAVLLVIVAVVAVLFYFFCYKTAASEARERKQEALIVRRERE